MITEARARLIEFSPLLRCIQAADLRKADGERERKKRKAEISDDKAKLGRAILDTLKDLNDPQYLEHFRLYAGLGVEPILIHLRRVECRWELPDGSLPESLLEEYFIGVDGVLYQNIYGRHRLTEGRESIGEEDKRGYITLKTPLDFKALSYESVASLHEAVTSEGFFDKLAFRLSRRGKPGYGDIWELNADKGLKNSHIE